MRDMISIQPQVHNDVGQTLAFVQLKGSIWTVHARTAHKALKLHKTQGVVCQSRSSYLNAYNHNVDLIQDVAIWTHKRTRELRDAEQIYAQRDKNSCLTVPALVAMHIKMLPLIERVAKIRQSHAILTAT